MKRRLHRVAQALVGILPGRRGRGRPGTPRSEGDDRSAGRPGTSSFDFDALAKDLAGGLSRREALRRLGVGLGTAALASLGLAAPALAACPKGTTLCGTKCVNL